jgi:PEP-CTERM motif
MKFSKLLLAAAPLLLFTSVSHAAVILTEGFNDITTLTGSGWVQTNNSTAGGTTGWFQGVPAVFNAQSGAANSYIAANFNNAADGGNISNWLILPNMLLTNGDTLTFYTRTETGAVPGDNLQVLMSTNGASTNVGATTTSVGDFTTSLATVGAGYPENWTQVTATLAGLAGPTSVRLAFRYVVTDTSVNGDYIGIDTVVVNSSVPEPGTLLMLGAGVAFLALKRVRSARA